MPKTSIHLIFLLNCIKRQISPFHFQPLAGLLYLFGHCGVQCF